VKNVKKNGALSRGRVYEVQNERQENEPDADVETAGWGGENDEELAAEGRLAHVVAVGDDAREVIEDVDGRLKGAAHDFAERKLEELGVRALRPRLATRDFFEKIGHRLYRLFLQKWVVAQLGASGRAAKRVVKGVDGALVHGLLVS